VYTSPGPRMPKVVVNTCYGGFSLSPDALERYKKYSQREKLEYGYTDDPKFRSDPHLVQVVLEMGDMAGGRVAQLGIADVPDDVTDFIIQEYDGKEWVAEAHRTWCAS